MAKTTQLKITQADLEELRKESRFVEFHIRPKVPAQARHIKTPWLVGLMGNNEYWLQPEVGDA